VIESPHASLFTCFPFSFSCLVTFIHDVWVRDFKFGLVGCVRYNGDSVIPARVRQSYQVFFAIHFTLNLTELKNIIHFTREFVIKGCQCEGSTHDFTFFTLSFMQKYYIFYGTVASGVSSVPVGSTTSTKFGVGNLQQSVVYVFEVSLGLLGPHSDPINSRPKSGASLKFA